MKMKKKFDQPFLSFQAKKIIGKSKICSMTKFFGALNNPNFDGNTLLLECEDSKDVYISGIENFEFRTSEKIIHYISLRGKNTLISYRHLTNSLKMIKSRKVCC